MKRMICAVTAVILMICLLAGCTKTEDSPKPEDARSKEARDLLTVVFDAPNPELIEAFESQNSEDEVKAIKEMFSGINIDENVEDIDKSDTVKDLHRALYESGATCKIVEFDQIRNYEVTASEDFISIIVTISGGRYDGIDFDIGVTLTFSDEGKIDLVQIYGQDYNILTDWKHLPT